MEFKAIQTTKNFKQINNAPPERIFPLLCPVRELDWLDGWEYNMIHSKSGLIEKGCVFSTPGPNREQTIWYVNEYDKEKFTIEFIRITPNVEVVKISIILKENGEGKTISDITYQFTGLSESRNSWIMNNLDQFFENFMLWWEKSINFYLETGEKLKKK
jgi:hypothetical protein